MSQDDHWNRVYGAKSADGVSWYTPELAKSLELIDEAGLSPAAALIDVGGGASTLPASLLSRGFSDLTVLDISHTAIEKARAQLGDRAAAVRWIVGDVTKVELPEAAFDLWHDRAVFHFLTEETDRMAYTAQVRRALKPDGWLIVATFGPRGPQKCSGLPIVRYDDASLIAQFGGEFERMRCCDDTHRTPWETEQAFVYCLCRRSDGHFARD